jgi:glycine/serine hydroxymethyltransferase
MTGASLLAERDPQVADLLAREHGRERATVRLIASEHYVSAAVLAAHGTSVIERCATGRPSARGYPGCAASDELERLAVRRAVELFGAEHADLQPSSGSVANLSGHLAVLRPGDAMLVPGPGAGGLPSHGAPTHLSSMQFDVTSYGVDPASRRRPRRHRSVGQPGGVSVRRGGSADQRRASPAREWACGRVVERCAWGRRRTATLGFEEDEMMGRGRRITQLLQTPGNEQALRRLRAAVASVARHACPSAQHGVETRGG